MDRRKKHTAQFSKKGDKPTAIATNSRITTSIAPKSVARTRQDIVSWNRALTMARKAEAPKRWQLYNLYDEIMLDALLKSQIENRMLKCLAQAFTLSDEKAVIDEEATNLLQNQIWVNEINKQILNTRYYGHSLVEFNYNDKGVLVASLIPRQNVDPANGLFYKDYSEDKGYNYRLMPEYGTWLVEFGDTNDLGLLNNAVPHVLFKRFAQACWSELCEIYGIPPRYMKTNTNDPNMVRRAERMMRDMGAAAWFIIDESEKFEFAQTTATNGDVYNNLITLCNNENSLLISGAIIGQDTKNGSRSKDESSQDMLQTLVESDLSLLEQHWNSTIIPALINIGVLSKPLVFSYPKAKNLDVLWQRTKDAFQKYDVNPEWIKDTFGIDVVGFSRDNQTTQKLNLDFFD
ncbi:DUF935 family protein [Flavobacterium oreochromis]|uniref:phage portal protein family protein n=1 Tax=Flavobacterium oreochromis TaxID=2906078 RepID=UPI003860009F